MDAPGIVVRRISGFGLNTLHADRLMEFYAAATGCRHLSSARRDGDGAGGACCHRMALGDQVIEMLEFDQPGNPSTAHGSPLDPAFQHFAIVVADMAAALAQLARVPGWTPISTHGSQFLPLRSGGVTAFKFRDPEGHPLEFLEFPRQRVPPAWRAAAGSRLFCGIDHSAISVANTAASAAYYARLGFEVTASSFNHGPEQDALDGVAAARVEVTALAPQAAEARWQTPHLELLCYQATAPRRHTAVHSRDVIASRVLLAANATSHTAVERTPPWLLLDPDGHRLEIHVEGPAPP